MSLVRVPIECSTAPLPKDIQDFIESADERITAFKRDRAANPIPAFVASDYSMAYHLFGEINKLNLSPGQRFLEWGSGFGVAACLAKLQGFEAWGIEIEQDLIDEANEILSENGLEVEYSCGSLIPPEAEEFIDDLRESNWHDRNGADAYEEIGLDIEDFDIVYAYPWPGEESLLDALFDQYASIGSLFVCYHGFEDFRIMRKT